MRWLIVIFDGFDELDALAPFEVLRKASASQPDWNVELASLEGAREVIANHGLRVHATAKLSPLGGPGRANVVIIPGGGWVDHAPEGARAEVERGILPAALAELHHAGALVASVCTGAMVLAAAGLLKNRPATTHHSAIEELRAAGAQIINARVVDAGSVVTAGGITSGLDLALHLVERFAGAALAGELAINLEYERRGEVWYESLKRPATAS